MDRYVHITDLSTKVFDDTLTVNTRTGGVFTSLYSKPISKFFIGQVAINIFSDSLPVYCPSVLRNDLMPVEGNVTNLYKLSEYKLVCVINDTEYPLELTETGRWSFKIPSQVIYYYSMTEVVLKLIGKDKNGNDFNISNSLPVKLASGCKTSGCNEGSISFNYYHNEVYTPTFTVDIEGEKVVVKGIQELQDFCKKYNLEIKVTSDD